MRVLARKECWPDILTDTKNYGPAESRKYSVVTRDFMGLRVDIEKVFHVNMHVKVSSS